jgi:hypothetical protein
MVKTISKARQPEEFLIAAYLMGADAMIEIIRQRAIATGHSGIVPVRAKLQSMINGRYKRPRLDGASIDELAQRNFTAGIEAVAEIFSDLVGSTDIPSIRNFEQLRTRVIAASRR